jgi:ATP-dependent protease Clp ATPase subunit
VRRDHCSFCDRGLAAVRKLIAGPGVTICNVCVADATETCDDVPGLVCDFCSEPQARGHRTDGASICEICIELCQGILREAAEIPRASATRQRN